MNKGRMERFTNRARHALSIAQQSAEQFQHNTIDSEHLLMGLMDGGISGKVLHDLGLNQRKVEALVRELSTAQQNPNHPPELSLGTKRTLEKAIEQARTLGHHYIGTEHLLLGLLEQKDSTALTILDRLGINARTARQYTLNNLSDEDVDTGNNPIAPFANERTRVLDMINDGKITALEGAELLKSMQITAVPFPMGQGITQILLPAPVPFETLQRRMMRMIIHKEDGTEVEIRHPMQQIQGTYLQLLQQYYNGATGKVMDVQVDDTTIDLYIDDDADTGESK